MHFPVDGRTLSALLFAVIKRLRTVSKSTGILLNFRVPAEFEIAIGIGIEIGSANVRLIAISDSDFDPDPDPDPDFEPQLS
jgi:hypothetical protein